MFHELVNEVAISPIYCDEFGYCCDDGKTGLVKRVCTLTIIDWAVKMVNQTRVDAVGDVDNGIPINDAVPLIFQLERRHERTYSQTGT